MNLIDHKVYRQMNYVALKDTVIEEFSCEFS